MGKGSRRVSFVWEVVPFSEDPLSEVPLYIQMIYCHGNGVQINVLSWEAAPFSGDPLLEVPLLYCMYMHAHVHVLYVRRTRTVTRGVNRGARVDLMGAMEKQIKRCDEPLEPILRSFFVQENLSIDT